MPKEHPLASFSHTVNACYGVTADQRIAFWNPSAELVFGRTAAEVVGQHCFETVRLEQVSGEPLCRQDCLPMQRARARRVVPTFSAVCGGAGFEPSIVDVMIVVVADPDTGEIFLVHYAQPAVDPVPTPSPSSALRARRPNGRRRPGLTPTDRRCLALLAGGASTAAIAAAMGVTHNTARNYVQHVIDKLGAHSRLEAVAIARRRLALSPADG